VIKPIEVQCQKSRRVFFVGVSLTLQQAHIGGEPIIGTPSSDLEESKEDEGNNEGKECRKPDRNDFFAQGVCKLRIGDSTVRLEDRE
jgi:hypothetical protein